MHTDRLFTVCYLPFTFFFLVLLTLLHNHRRARNRVLVSFGAFFVSVLAVPLVRPTTPHLQLDHPVPQCIKPAACTNGPCAERRKGGCSKQALYELGEVSWTVRPHSHVWDSA